MEDTQFETRLLIRNVINKFFMDNLYLTPSGRSFVYPWRGTSSVGKSPLCYFRSYPVSSPLLPLHYNLVDGYQCLRRPDPEGCEGRTEYGLDSSGTTRVSSTSRLQDNFPTSECFGMTTFVRVAPTHWTGSRILHHLLSGKCFFLFAKPRRRRRRGRLGFGNLWLRGAGRGVGGAPKFWVRRRPEAGERVVTGSGGREHRLSSTKRALGLNPNRPIDTVKPDGYCSRTDRGGGEATEPATISSASSILNSPRSLRDNSFLKIFKKIYLRVPSFISFVILFI